ncbi:HTH-type transcriptional regulator PrtR [Achromobacter piechaudii]|uniref:HTH-type transcriptional regulator PrtR n=2 Tax=Achromobacter piechaudii TaxID=72556 RepID=A0ABM8L534_9BURK|nr:HTH-type transcriptional regulator PrtR [Achromobacter piechaudii]
MPAQPLTPAQLADAARLKSLFLEWKEDRRARGEPASQETVAALLGFNTQSSVSQYLNGRIPLNVNALVKFAALLGKQPEDISIDLAKEIQRIAEAVPSDTEGEEFIPIRRLDVRLSAGRGQLFTSEEEKSRLSFRADFLQSIGAAPHNTVSVSVSGDSMEPIIPDGSTLLVDRGNRHVVNGKVYALRQNGCLLVKRLYTTTSGYVARSDNAAENYPDIPLDEEHPDFEIIGRAVWVGFKL